MSITFAGGCPSSRPCQEENGRRDQLVPQPAEGMASGIPTEYYLAALHIFGK